MKALLVTEQRDGKGVEANNELHGFAERLGAETAIVMIGDRSSAPGYTGKVYLADASACGEYSPELHRQLVISAAEQERPDVIVFLHSSYGWDLAPRVAARLGWAQISEVTRVGTGGFEVPCCNGKMCRTVRPGSAGSVVTIQVGAFPGIAVGGEPCIVPLRADTADERVWYVKTLPADEKTVDLGRAEVIIGAGRGIGKQENMVLLTALAKAIGGEIAASRPAVDAGWIERCRQIGTTGQSIAPKLYIACGISGATQHVAGIKGAGYVVAINKDRDAPIGEVADVLVVADAPQLVQALTAAICG